MGMDTTNKMVISSIVLAIVALFAPLVTADVPVFVVDGNLVPSVIGYEDESETLVLILGPVIIAGLAALVGRWGKITVAIVGLAGIWVAFLSSIPILNPTAYVSLENPEQVIDAELELEHLVDPGFGLFLWLFSGLLLIGAAFSGYKRPSGSETSKQNITQNERDQHPHQGQLENPNQPSDSQSQGQPRTRQQQEQQY